MRFCVVALNPAIDAEWRVDDVLWEEKNVVHSQRRWPGGKGVNVARWLKFLGTDSELLIPLGGTTGGEMASGLRKQSLRAHIIRLREETRVNVVVTTARGRQMRFNPPGPKLSAREWQSVLRAAKRIVERGASLILSGALPRGVPTTAYAQLVRLAHQFSQRTFLDCDGEALVAGVKAKPFFLKPNLHELSRWAGRKLHGERAIISAAQKLSSQTGGWVLVSLGAEGGLLVNAREEFAARAAAPRVQVVNTVGAGDAMLAAAAQAVAQDLPPIDWLRAAVAVGTAATQCQAGGLPQKGSGLECADLWALFRGTTSRPARLATSRQTGKR
jgi:1-phosphofructokinase family hexose kinase